MADLERLHKVMARAGVGSRRACERIIQEGRVRVNGQVVTQLGTRIDPERDRVEVDGRALEQLAAHLSGPGHLYVAVNKPKGVITTSRDPQGRLTVLDLVPLPRRLFAVGRLDADSEGLVLLTDDGELAHAVTHPSRHVAKLYRVRVAGVPSPMALRSLRSGVRLEDGPTAPAGVQVLRAHPRGAWTELGFELHEGRKRQIRRMCEAVGHPVLRLVRVAIGPVRLGRLLAGHWRYLRPQEVEALRQAAGLVRRPTARPQPATARALQSLQAAQAAKPLQLGPTRGRIPPTDKHL